MRIIIKSNAKINFGLNIISKRPDGFHNLNTIFYPVGLHDTITFEKADFTELLTDSEVLSGELSSNLIIRAHKLLEEHTGKILPIRINLEKKIPMGAGLGGGSSNAACTLLSINDLYNLTLNGSTLNSLASKLGSDVACFLKPVPAFGESRGEILTPVDFEINKPMVLLNPGIHVSTVWAYKNIIPKMQSVDLREIIAKKSEDFSFYRDKITNDFEVPVFREFPELARIKSDFYNHGAEFALMSGSGSTLFGIFGDNDAAIKFADRYKEKYFVYTQLKDDDENLD